jgi:hypothetical protein
MQIITALPRFSDGEINRALIKEIKTGFQLAKANEKREELIAAHQAQEIKGHKTIPGLGKCVAMFPPDEYFRLIKKYGRKELLSKEFLRYFNKKFPHLSPNKA